MSEELAATTTESDQTELPPPAFTWCRTGKHHHCPGAIEATSSRHVPREAFLQPLRCSCGCHVGAAIRRRKWAPC